MSRIEWFHFAVKTFAFTVMVTSGVFVVLIAGPALETKFYPVVGTLRIDKVEAVSPEISKVWASYLKLRPCEYIGTSWYRTADEDGSLDRVGMETTRRFVDGVEALPLARPLGLNRVGPWTVAMPADRIRNQSFVEVFHRCTILWVTRSQFYP